MPETTKETTLLHSLLECFSSSKTVIRYVIEKDRDGKLVYEVPAENYVEWWPILFSKNLVSLSIAPRSHDKSLSKDALSAFVRKVINDKNKSIFEKNLKPRLAGAKCCDLIVEEVDHLSHTIEMGVRAFHSPYDPYKQEIPAKDLKGADEVQIFISEAIEFLEQLFLGEPFEILSHENNWFVDCIPDLEKDESRHFTKKQILSMLACALIISLNITNQPEINDNVMNYISEVFSDKPKAPEASSANASTTETRGAVPVSESHETIYADEDQEVLRKTSMLISRSTKVPVDDSLLKEVTDIIDAWKKSSMHIWKTLTEKQKIFVIRKDYFDLLDLEKEMVFSVTARP